MVADGVLPKDAYLTFMGNIDLVRKAGWEDTAAKPLSQEDTNFLQECFIAKVNLKPFAKRLVAELTKTAAKEEAKQEVKEEECDGRPAAAGTALPV